MFSVPTESGKERSKRGVVVSLGRQNDTQIAQHHMLFI